MFIFPQLFHPILPYVFTKLKYTKVTPILLKDHKPYIHRLILLRITALEVKTLIIGSLLHRILELTDPTAGPDF